MKRNLITAAALYLIYERQRRVERRLQEERAARLADKADVGRLIDIVREVDSSRWDLCVDRILEGLG